MVVRGRLSRNIEERLLKEKGKRVRINIPISEVQSNLDSLKQRITNVWASRKQLPKESFRVAIAPPMTSSDVKGSRISNQNYVVTIEPVKGSPFKKLPAAMDKFRVKNTVDKPLLGYNLSSAIQETFRPGSTKEKFEKSRRGPFNIVLDSSPEVIYGGRMIVRKEGSSAVHLKETVDLLANIKGQGPQSAKNILLTHAQNAQRSGKNPADALKEGIRIMLLDKEIQSHLGNKGMIALNEVRRALTENKHGPMHADMLLEMLKTR